MTNNDPLIVMAPPEVVAQLHEIQVSVGALKGQADGMEIVSQEGVEMATKFLSLAKEQLGKIEEARTFFVKPLNDQVKVINARFKEYTEPLEQIYQAVRRKVGDFQLAQMKAAREEEERLRKQRELRDEKREERGVEPVAAPAPVVRAEITTRADNGAKSVGAKVWKFEITDAGGVPREYCEPSDKLIRAAVRAGTRQIAGVRIFEDVEVRVS